MQHERVAIPIEACDRCVEPNVAAGLTEEFCQRLWDLLKSFLKAFVLRVDAEVGEIPRDRVSCVPISQRRIVTASVYAEQISLATDRAQQHIPETLLIQWLSSELRGLRQMPALVLVKTWIRDPRHDLLNSIDNDAARRPAALQKRKVIRHLAWLGGEVRES